MNDPLLGIAGLAVACGVCQWLSWRFRLPSILFLLTTGIMVGPVFSLFDPDAFFGDLLFPFVSVAVAIILFEGGMTLKIKDIRGHGSVVTRLITLGALVTWLMLAAAVALIFGMDWQLALVFGAITVVSGPTVIKPLLRTVRPNAKVGTLLNWEGILIDPMGVFLALLVFEFVLLDHPGSGATTIVLILGKLIVIGTALGVAAGAATTYVLRRYLVPDYLVNVMTLVMVIYTFVVAEKLQHESGLLAVTIMGMWLANARGLHIEEILNFKEDLSVLLISALFIVLAARLDIAIIPQYGWQIILLLVTAQFVIRPINAALCTIGSDLNWRERVFIGWIAPRGIVAAAISSLFFLRLEETGVPQAELLVPLTFSLIIGTVVFQSLTAKPLAERLGISNPEPNGVLFFGANELALPLAEAIRKESVAVTLTDMSWGNVKRARDAGFEAYHGNPTSGHAAENLNMEGLGKLIAVSDNRDRNALAGMHFRQEFGSQGIFTLEGSSDDDVYDRFDTANRNRGNPLFNASMNYATLRRRLAEGDIRHLQLVAPPAPDEQDEDEDESKDENKDTHRDDAQEAPTGESAASSAIDSTIDNSDDLRPPISDDNSPDSKRLYATDENGDACSVDDQDLRLFALDSDRKLFIYGAGEAFNPKPGWRLIVLRERDSA